MLQSEGWLGYTEAAAEGGLEWGSFEPKPWEEIDIDIEVIHYSVYRSDIHVLRSE